MKQDIKSIHQQTYLKVEDHIVKFAEKVVRNLFEK